MLEGEKVAVIAAGPFAYRAVEAAEQIRQEKGWNPAIYNIRYIKPIDTRLLAEVYENFDRVVTVEDGTVLGGLYGAVSEFMSAQEKPLPVRAIGIPDRYINQGTQQELRQECGLTVNEMKSVILSEYEKI